MVIINKSGITLRVSVSAFRIMGRATQGVRLINLEKRNDQIGSICKVDSEPAEEELQGEAGEAPDLLQGGETAPEASQEPVTE